MNGRIIFVMCVAASAAMISGFATMAAHRGSEPLYVAGMALANTTMSRLYAMRLRTFFGRVQIPWPIWRGDREAVEHVNRRMQQMSCAPHQR
jgi:hypothetical protein